MKKGREGGWEGLVEGTKKRQNFQKNTTMYDFVLKVVPEDIKSELSVELIDEIFQYVTSTHSS